MRLRAFVARCAIAVLLVVDGASAEVPSDETPKRLCKKHVKSFAKEAPYEVELVEADPASECTSFHVDSTKHGFDKAKRRLRLAAGDRSEIHVDLYHTVPDANRSCRIFDVELSLCQDFPLRPAPKTDEDDRPSPPKRRIGLALSGGGTRAAAWHHGVVRAVDDLGYYDRVQVVSCVSGGCIAAGAMIGSLGGNPKEGLERLAVFLKDRQGLLYRRRDYGNVAYGWIRPFKTTTELLADSLDDLDHRTLSDFTGKSPRFYFNSTNLSTGNRFFFAVGAAKEISEDEVPFTATEMRDGSSLTCGRSPLEKRRFCPSPSADETRLSVAIAASAAFPPYFTPIRMEFDDLRWIGFNPDEEPLSDDKVRDALGIADQKFVTLSDGGLYDNLALAPFVHKFNQWGDRLDLVIVSDGGAPFSPRAPRTGLGAAFGLHEVQMREIEKLDEEAMDRGCALGGAKPVYLDVKSASPRFKLSESLCEQEDVDRPGRLLEDESDRAIATCLKSLDTSLEAYPEPLFDLLSCAGYRQTKRAVLQMRGERRKVNPCKDQACVALNAKVFNTKIFGESVCTTELTTLCGNEED